MTAIGNNFGISAREYPDNDLSYFSLGIYQHQYSWVLVLKKLFGVGVDGIDRDRYCDIDKIISLVVLVLNSIVVFLSVFYEYWYQYRSIGISNIIFFFRMHTNLTQC